MYYDYGARRINDWLVMKKNPIGNPRNIEYIRELNQLFREFKRIAIITYMLKTRFGIEDVQSMLSSATKQRDFVYAVKLQVKEYGVDPEWDRVFDHDIDSMKRRVAYVFRVMADIIKLTELYPYFRAVGFERLVDYGFQYPNESDKATEVLAREIAEYNKKHPEEVAEHMRSTQAERDARDRHRQKIAEQTKLEKESNRLAKKLMRQEEKEIKENAKKEKRRKAIIDKSFARYWE